MKLTRLILPSDLPLWWLKNHFGGSRLLCPEWRKAPVNFRADFATRLSELVHGSTLG